MDTKQLVSIGREDINDNDINGFLIKESEELLLVHIVYDFTLDGLQVIRQSDVSDISQFNTDIFQTERLKELGIYEQIKFDAPCSIDSWRDFFTSAQRDFTFFIVEDERDGVFHLGLITDINPDSIVMRTCDGAGKWHPTSTTIAYEAITSVQAGSNYSKVYEEFMMRDK